MRAGVVFDEDKIRGMARKMRRDIIDMAYECGGNAHVGPALSMVEILSVLYGAVMVYDAVNPHCQDRDRFILSKGHGALGYYAALAMAGFFPPDLLGTYQQNGTDLVALTSMNVDLGIESSNGSLGHGLSLAVGIALYAKLRGKKFRTYAMLGNGECNEGSVWEAVMASAHYKLDNLTAVIDDNSMQSDGESSGIMDLEPIGEKFSAFGWDTITVDGHDICKLFRAFTSLESNERPKAIVARTIKGKGVSFMENSAEWHNNRLTKRLYDQALSEMGVA